MNEKELEKVLKAIANRRRVQILKYLKKAKRSSVGNMAAETRLSFQATSRHLSILYSVNILDKRQESLVVWYFLAKNMNPVVKKLLSVI